MKEEEPKINAKESRVSRDKGGASPESASNRFDSSITQNEGGTGADSGNGTAGTEYTSVVSGAESVVKPEARSSTDVADSAEVEGDDCRHGNTGGAEHSSATEFPGAKEVPGTAPLPETVEEKCWGAVPMDTKVQ